jgi:hypothetical protein
MGSDRYNITITQKMTASSSLSQSRAVTFMAGKTPLPVVYAKSVRAPPEKGIVRLCVWEVV